MYLIQIDHIIYKQIGGGYFTLAQAWEELRGVGHARILDSKGRVVLRNAGAVTQRKLEVHKLRWNQTMRRVGA
jgi:hypothetical protein